VSKILHPVEFAKIVNNYQVLPDVLINLTALILPWLELVLGLLLVFNFWLPSAVLLTNLLLFSFYVVLVFNVARGLNIHCGCFSTSEKGDPATTWYLIRDGAFLLMGGYLFYKVLISRWHNPESGACDA